MKIGLIVNVLDEEYQNSIFAGVKKRALEYGVQLFCIQHENSKNIEKSLIYDIHKKEYFDLDGIILLNSVLADSFPLKTAEQVKRIWGNLPVLSLGQEIEGIPSVLVQTDYSMKQLVEHLIINHEYRNFVFLAGPENHQDAIQRKEIFLKTMEVYKPWFSDLSYIIKTGAFIEVSAINMMTELYEHNPDLNPDVIVCSTDNMAIGVYKFFKMNRNNPHIKECAVTGFDDIPQSRYELPSITTVQQPLEEMGCQAVDKLIKMINKEKIAQVSYIESSLIFRESCGCSFLKQSPEQEKKLLTNLQSDYIFSEHMLRLITRFEQDLNNSNSRDLMRFYIDSNIRSFDIKNFCVLLIHKENNKVLFEPFYVLKNCKKIDPFNNYKTTELNEFLELFYNAGEKSDTRQDLVFKYLLTNQHVFGCVLYTGNNNLNTYLSSMVVSISQSISRILNLEEKQRYSDYLEEEVSKRTHELLEANNKRMEVEAEVLRISELERQRFSNDLHDDICQRLAGISMLCRSYSNQTKPVEKQQMIELAELISETLQTTRQYAHNSYPVELESLGLNYAISNLCNSFEKQTGIHCEYLWKLDENLEFDSTQKLNIFRIIQEALHNTIKHAKAKNVKVSFENIAETVEIKICDDGCGILEKNDTKKQGLGINSMKYRANQIGAEFRIEKNIPSGTCVIIVINLRNLEEKDL